MPFQPLQVPSEGELLTKKGLSYQPSIERGQGKENTRANRQLTKMERGKKKTGSQRK